MDEHYEAINAKYEEVKVQLGEMLNNHKQNLFWRQTTLLHEREKISNLKQSLAIRNGLQFEIYKRLKG